MFFLRFSQVVSEINFKLLQVVLKHTGPMQLRFANPDNKNMKGTTLFSSLLINLTNLPNLPKHCPLCRLSSPVRVHQNRDGIVLVVSQSVRNKCYKELKLGGWYYTHTWEVEKQHNVVVRCTVAHLRRNIFHPSPGLRHHCGVRVN